MRGSCSSACDHAYLTRTPDDQGRLFLIKIIVYDSPPAIFQSACDGQEEEEYGGRRAGAAQEAADIPRSQGVRKEADCRAGGSSSRDLQGGGLYLLAGL